MRYLYLTVFISLLFCSPTLAQKEGNIWYFGEQAGLSFNSGSPVPLLDGVINTIEGCASIADKNGKLLFYTDGITVWNNQHQIMSNGTGLLSDNSATQAAAIVPKPGSTTEYYIFTVDRAEVSSESGLRYSVVDMSLPPGSGLGTVTEKNKPLLQSSTEKITAVKHHNGIDVWLLAHELSTNVFHSFLVTSAGVNPVSIKSAVGSVYSQGIGYLKASQDGNRIAAVVDFNLFETYGFNTATGQVHTPIKLQISPLHLCYGVEFSPDGKLLYGSKVRRQLSRFPSEILQFNLEAGTEQDIVNSATFIGAVPVTDATTSLPSSAGALQIAPDGKIYIAREGSEYLAVIEKPNALGSGCGFVLDGVFLGTRASHFGLPNSNQTYYRVSEFLYSNLCIGDSTRFALSDDAFPLDSVLWNFGDPTTGKNDTSTSLTPAHLFSTSGTYTVSLRLFRAGREDVVIKDIPISPRPSVYLGNDTTLCQGSALLLTTGTPGMATYRWSTGGTTASISVDKPGTYWVEVSNGLCSNTDTIVVDTETVVFDAGMGGRICRGQSVQLLASSTQELSYTWTPIHGLDNPNIANPVAQPTTTTMYTVTATSKRGCTTSATVTISVDEPFNFDLGEDIIACDGRSNIVLDATTTGATYLWSTGETTPTISISTSGVYSVVVTVGTCTAMDDVRVVLGRLVLSTGSNHTICQGESVRLSASGAQTYAWLPTENLDDPTLATPIATPTQTTTYRVIGTSGKECRDTSYITVFVEPAFTIELGSDTLLCQSSSHTLHAPVSNAVYQWSTGETSSSITATTTGTYWVVVRRGTCVQTDTINLVFSHFALVVDTPPAPLCAGESVQLQAQGAQAYRWTPTVGLDSPSSPTPIATPLTTTLYTVTGTDANGCTDSKDILVEVSPKHQLTFALAALTEKSGAHNVALPLTVHIPSSSIPLTIHNLVVECRWNASLLQPENVDNGLIATQIEGKELVVTLSLGDVAITTPTQIIAVITGSTLVGDSIATPLHLSKIQHKDCLLLTTNDGILTLEGCFLEGRRVQYFIPTSVTVSPNPANDDVQIHISTSETGFCTVGIYNVQGQRVWNNRAILSADKSEHVLTVPAGTLPAGIYHIVLSTTAGVQTTMLHVVQ